jgi:hypothetical protein
MNEKKRKYTLVLFSSPALLLYSYTTRTIRCYSYTFRFFCFFSLEIKECWSILSTITHTLQHSWNTKTLSEATVVPLLFFVVFFCREMTMRFKVDYARICYWWRSWDDGWWSVGTHWPEEAS